MYSFNSSAAPKSLWCVGSSSVNGDRTLGLLLLEQSLSPWTAREVPRWVFTKTSFFCLYIYIYYMGGKLRMTTWNYVAWNLWASTLRIFPGHRHPMEILWMEIPFLKLSWVICPCLAPPWFCWLEKIYCYKCPFFSKGKYIFYLFNRLERQYKTFTKRQEEG